MEEAGWQGSKEKDQRVPGQQWRMTAVTWLFPQGWPTGWQLWKWREGMFGEAKTSALFTTETVRLSKTHTCH
jgi:hypothetical protein